MELIILALRDHAGFPVRVELDLLVAEWLGLDGTILAGVVVLLLSINLSYILPY